MCWNYIKMFYWCNLSPPEMFWSWLEDIDELVLIAREKAIRTKKWGVTFEDDLLCHLYLPPAMFLVRQKLISLRHGGWVVFASELKLHYIIIDSISISERRTGWSIHSSAGAHTKTGYLAEWNQIVSTWFNHWNHRLGTSLVQSVHGGSNRSESLCFL